MWAACDEPVRAAICQRMLGLVRKVEGRFTESFFESKAALAVFVSRGEVMQEALTLSIMATALDAQGNWSAGLDALRRADEAILLADQARPSDALTKRRAAVASNTAQILSHLGRGEDAVASFEKAYQLRAAALHSNEHPGALMSLANYAHELLNHGPQTTAGFQAVRGLLERGERILKRHAGLGNTSAAALVSVACGRLALAEGHAVEAERYFQRGLATQRTLFPPDHPNIADTLMHIVVCQQAQGSSAATATLAEYKGVIKRSQVACAAPGCPRKVRSDGEPLDQCAGCLRTYYCSVACQRAGWKAGHKAECKALRKEATAAGSGSAAQS